MSKRRMVFDLDGTLVDASDRMYFLFTELVPECRLSKDEYWALKRNKVSHQDILTTRCGYSERDFELFEQRWMKQIECPRSIARDKLYHGVQGVLSGLIEKGFALYLITARQLPAVAISEVSSYGIDAFFSDIIVTGPDRDKKRAIAPLMPFSKRDVFVGDTGRDVQFGRSLGGQTVAVTNGFLSRERLLEYGPDVILDNICELMEVRYDTIPIP